MKNRRRRQGKLEEGRGRVSANFLVGAQNLGKLAETLPLPSSTMAVKYY
jgi:hypothetical protein